MSPSSTRRRFLVAASALLGLGTGCLERAESTGKAPTATESTGDARSVTVARSRTSARAPTEWERTLTVSTADGRVTETLVCGDDTGSDSASLPDAALAPFRELESAAVSELSSTYACEGPCPTDIPPTEVTITTPSTERTVTVEAGAETPALLDRLTSALDAASQHVSTGGCAPAPATETP